MLGIRLQKGSYHGRGVFCGPKTVIQACKLSSRARLFKSHHSDSYKDADTTVETDEFISENNPWSPTLYNDVVRVRKAGSLRATELPAKYRLSYKPLYEAPSAKYVAMMKRLTLSFAVLGTYGAKLFWESAQFEDVYALATLVSCVAPAAFVQYKTRHYVSRIFRLYDKETPQTLENLLNDEKLVAEKINLTGGKTYNTLLTVTGNTSLKLAQPAPVPALSPYASWEEIDPESGSKRYFYVVDDIGGLKMDRIWGIIEHNSNIDNGRYIELPASTQ